MQTRTLLGARHRFVRRTATLATLMLVGIAILPSPALAQSATAPVEPGVWSKSLEIGPVAGLTTAWHAAPRATGIPLGSTVQLRLRVQRDARATWHGTREIDSSHGRSTAEARFDTAGHWSGVHDAVRRN